MVCIFIFHYVTVQDENTAKFSVHRITTAFLMGLFDIVDTPTVSNSIGSRNVKMNHFLVPTVIPTILGTFLETLIDQYVGPLEVSKRTRIIERFHMTSRPPYLCPKTMKRQPAMHVDILNKTCGN